MQIGGGGEGGEGGGSSFVSEAMMFVQEVKTEYQGSSVYYDFLDILKDYRAKPDSIDETVQRVNKLFKGNNKLIQHFSKFHEHNVKKLEKGSVEDYLTKIKHRFESKPQIYLHFLETLTAAKDAMALERDLVKLFRKSHEDDLIEGLRALLPTSASTTMIENIQPSKTDQKPAMPNFKEGEEILQTNSVKAEQRRFKDLRSLSSSRQPDAEEVEGFIAMFVGVAKRYRVLPIAASVSYYYGHYMMSSCHLHS